MSIIRATQEWLSQYNGMTILTERTEGAGTYALSPSGNVIKSVDIAGNRKYQNSYQFLARERRENEVDRQDTYDFLERLASWVEEQGDNDNYPILPEPYSVCGVEVSHGMLMDVSDGGEGTYQIQINLIIKKERKA